MVLQTGIVLKRMKSFYYVDVEGQVHLCRIKGNLFKESRYEEKIAVGDRVEVDLEAAQDAGWIYQILPRTSKLSRPGSNPQIEEVLVSNVENLLIVSAIQQPAFRPGIIDRFLVTAQLGQLQPVLVLTKLDLAQPGELAPIQALYQSLGVKVIGTSIPLRQGLEELREVVQGHLSLLAGHSGVGKSSLLKALYPDREINIGSVNEATSKGRHTTTLAEMFPLPGGGYLADTPGIRELSFYQLEAEDLDQYFVEFASRRQGCKFKGCSHRHEPGCAIKNAVEAGEVAASRYQSYLTIFESLQETAPRQGKRR